MLDIEEGRGVQRKGFDPGFRAALAAHPLAAHTLAALAAHTLAACALSSALAAHHQAHPWVLTSCRG